MYKKEYEVNDKAWTGQGETTVCCCLFSIFLMDNQEAITQHTSCLVIGMSDDESPF